MENRNNAQEPLLQVRGLSLRFPVKQGLLDILMRRPQPVSYTHLNCTLNRTAPFPARGRGFCFRGVRV